MMHNTLSLILGNGIDFHSKPFNVTVLRYGTLITVHIPIDPDGVLSYTKVFGLRFSIPNNADIRPASLNESQAEIINTDSKCMFVILVLTIR